MHPYLEKKFEHIISISYNRQTYNFPSHFHEQLEIAFCFSGMQDVRVGEKIYTLKKGDVIAIFPNTAHEYIRNDSSSDEDTEVLAIICNIKLLNLSIPDIVTKHPKEPFLESSLISENTACAFRKVTETRDMIEQIGWTYIILSDLMNKFELVSSEGDIELPAKIVDYINANFKEPLTINYIAKTFGYHPSYIAHLFCDQLKIPFRTHLGAVRSEYAASLIRTTEKSLTEIAYESGYNSLNTFCRSFKKYFSKTPSQYRHDIKKENKDSLPAVT